MTMATPDDYLAILHVDDGVQWANFLSARLSGPNYGIKSVLKNLNSVSCSDENRPPSTNSQASSKKDDNLEDSGRGSCAIPDVNFNSDLTDNPRARVFLLSPDMLSSDIFPVDVSSLNARRSVFLFLGVEIEEVRAYFGQYHSYVFNSHCCVLHTDERSISDAMVQIIVAYEYQGESSLEEEDEDKDIYKRPPSPRQLNSIEKVLTQEICGTDRDVYFLLERPAEETLHVVLDKGDELSVTCVCDRLYKFTLPVAASGEVIFKVECRHHVVGEDSVLVLTKLDKLRTILSEEVSPLSAIAAALGLNSDDLESIDDALALKLRQLMPLKTFQEMFPCEEALNYSITEERADVTYPSLLHFAADWNLQKFCSELLRYPGMLSAAMTENKDGDDPSTMAFKKGYEHLESVLMQFVADHKSSDDSEYVQPAAPKPHVAGKAPGYVNLPHSEYDSSGLYVPMEDLREFQKPNLDSGSQRSGIDTVSPVSHTSENVFSDQSSITSETDETDLLSNWNLGPRSKSVSGTTRNKALKILGVVEADIRGSRTTPLTKKFPRSEVPISKPFLGMIPHGVRYPGISQMTVDQDRVSVNSNSNSDNSATYGVQDSKHKVNKIAAFFGKIKSKRSASEGENFYIPARAMKKTQSARGDKLKKKSTDPNNQERDSGSYSDDENGKKMSDAVKKTSKPKEFRERETPMSRTRPMSRRALLARQEHDIKDAPKVPDTSRRKESFTSFIENF